MKPCRTCGQNVSEQATVCPNCGEPYPTREKDNSAGRGFEYKSEASLFGLPWLHISFKYRSDRKPVPAVGVIAIGQFAFGLITISQFGVGLFSLSQITIAGSAVAQFAFAYNLIAPFGIYLHQGRGPLVISLARLVRFFS